jgi:hypothetical protein
VRSNRGSLNAAKRKPGLVAKSRAPALCARESFAP